MSSQHERRSIPGAIGVSLAISAVCGAMSFFVALFFAIVVFFLAAWHRGNAQAVDFGETYRIIALPFGIAGLVIGFFWTLVHSLRRRAGKV